MWHLPQSAAGVASATARIGERRLSWGVAGGVPKGGSNTGKITKRTQCFWTFSALNRHWKAECYEKSGGFLMLWRLMENEGIFRMGIGRPSVELCARSGDRRTTEIKETYGQYTVRGPSTSSGQVGTRKEFGVKDRRTTETNGTAGRDRNVAPTSEEATSSGRLELQICLRGGEIPGKSVLGAVMRLLARKSIT